MSHKKLFAYFLISILLSSCTFSSKDQPSGTKDNALLADFATLTDQGLKEFNEGKYDEAQKSFERGLQLSPDSAVAMNNLGSVLNAKKQFKLGLELCRKAMQSDPGLQIAKNNFEFAKSQYEKLDVELKGQLQRLKKADVDDAARIEIGLRYYQVGDFERAVDIWSDVGSGSKHFAKAQNNVATGLIQLKKFDQASAALATALKISPSDPGFLANQKWLNEEKSKIQPH